MILGQGLIFLFKVLSFDYQMTYCFQWMRTLLLSMWTPIYLHQVHFPEFNRWSKKVKVHAYLNRISTLLICTTCGKVYKQILLKIFQNINQDNLHYSHILLPLHFFNYITRRARWEWPNIARFAMLDCLASKVLNACF